MTSHTCAYQLIIALLQRCHLGLRLQGRLQKRRCRYVLKSRRGTPRRRRRLHSWRSAVILKLKLKSANVNSSVVIAVVATLWCHRFHLYFVLRGSSAQAWYSRATSAVSSRLLLSDREQKCEITN